MRGSRIRVSKRFQMLGAPTLACEHNFIDQLARPTVIDWRREPAHARPRLDLDPCHETPATRQLHVVVVDEYVGQSNLLEQPDPGQEHRLGDGQNSGHSSHDVFGDGVAQSATTYPITGI